MPGSSIPDSDEHHQHRSKSGSSKKRPSQFKLQHKYKHQEIDRNNMLAFHKEHPEKSTRDLARQFHIPKTVVNDLINHKTTSNAIVGHPCYLDEAEERELVDWIFEMINNCFPVDKSTVLKNAQRMIKQKTGKDLQLSEGWYYRFRERNPDVVRRVKDDIEMDRFESEKEETAKDFFEKLKTVIIENNLSANQVYNCDETGIKFNESEKYTLAKKGSKHVRVKVDSKSSLSSILACGNANGDSIPPLLIHPHKRLTSADFGDGLIGDSTVGLSTTGFVNRELFQQWFTHNFLKHANTLRPLLLVLDNHTSHIDIELLKKARDNRVIIMCIPPHTSHLYQPLDVGVFHYMKVEFRKLSSKYTREHLEEKTQKEFVQFLYEAHQKSMIKEYLTSGFERACIYPCDIEKAISKVKPPNKETSQTDPKKNTKYGSILVVPKPIPTNHNNVSFKPKSILTEDEYIIALDEHVKKKKEKETQVEENKRKRVEKHEKKIKESNESEIIKKQKKEGLFCNCHKLCSSGKVCACIKAGRSCTDYCSCHKKCKNSNCASTSKLPTTTNVCCVSKCCQVDSPPDFKCQQCGKMCHKNSCTMPMIIKVNNKDQTITVCNDCGEKE